MTSTTPSPPPGDRRPCQQASGAPDLPAPALPRRHPPPSPKAARSSRSPCTERYTGGNPFYVHEILASGDCRDSHLDPRRGPRPGLASSSPESRAVPDAAAVIGVLVDPDLLEATIGGPTADAVDEALAAGLFRPFGDRLDSATGSPAKSFSRQCRCPAGAVPPPHPRHPRKRSALRHRPAHLAHHAEEANDAQAVLCHAPVAARGCPGLRAHRQAAFQYAPALRLPHSLPEPELAACWRRAPTRLPHRPARRGPIADQARAVASGNPLVTRSRLGVDRCWLSRFAWFAGRNADAELTPGRARISSEPAARPGIRDGVQQLLPLRMLAYNCPMRIHWGNRPSRSPPRSTIQPILVHALANVGTANALRAGTRMATDLLDEGSGSASPTGLDDDVAQAPGPIGLDQPRPVRPGRGGAYDRTALAFTAERDLIAMELYLKAARIPRLARPRRVGTGARQAPASPPRRAPRPSPDRGVDRVGRARRQGTIPATDLDDALALAEPTRSAHAAGTAPDRPRRSRLARRRSGGRGRNPRPRSHACGRAKPGWPASWRSGGTGRDLRTRSRPAAGSPRPTGSKSQAIGTPPPGFGEGESCSWRRPGPLPAAPARALRTALAMLDRMGARPDAARVADRLRALGFRNIRRGPHAATRANHAMLTPRELGVLALIAGKATNRDIAQQLYLSKRTVEHHVLRDPRQAGRRQPGPTRSHGPGKRDRHGLTGWRGLSGRGGPPPGRVPPLSARSPASRRENGHARSPVRFRSHPARVCRYPTPGVILAVVCGRHANGCHDPGQGQQRGPDPSM